MDSQDGSTGAEPATAADTQCHGPANASRRRWLVSLGGWPLLPLAGCAAPLPPTLSPTSAPEAQALLRDSAEAHGQAAFARLQDLSLSYQGEWRALIGRIQPVLADTGFRGGSQERMLLRSGWVAQSHTGVRGRKQVLWRDAPGRPEQLRVWFNGEESHDAPRRAAAALVVDGYSLFLLGPMLLVERWAVDRQLVLEMGGVDLVNDHVCDVLRLRVAPGFGLAAADQLALFIDRKERLMRRVRFSLEGLASTAGAIAEVDAFDHIERHGVRWPTRFHERLLRPFPLPVHDWVLTGLDVDRGMSLADLGAGSFQGAAVAPAALLPGAGAAG